MEQTGAEAQRLLVAVVGSGAGIEADKRQRADILRLHVQRSAEGTGTIRRGAGTALQLHALHR